MLDEFPRNDHSMTNDNDINDLKLASYVSRHEGNHFNGTYESHKAAHGGATYDALE